MNFCPECGTDLRSNQDAKFCFNCGVKMTSDVNVRGDNLIDQSVTQDEIVEDVFDDFDYFDFPNNEKYFEQFLTFVDEHIALTPSLTKKDVAEKYFEQGKLMFSVTFEEWDSFQNKKHHDADIEMLADIAINCYEACWYFGAQLYVESLFQLAACFHYKNNFNKAFSHLRSFAIQNNNLYGLRSNETSKAKSLCLNYPHTIIDDLPLWIVDDSCDTVI